MTKTTPELLDWRVGAEPVPQSCRHLCNRAQEHECLGKADGNFAYRDGSDPTPMCTPCREVATARGFRSLTPAVDQRVSGY